MIARKAFDTGKPFSFQRKALAEKKDIKEKGFVFSKRTKTKFPAEPKTEGFCAYGI